MSDNLLLGSNVENEVLDLIFSKLDKGQGCPRGLLRIYTSGGPNRGTLLSTLTLNLPAFSKAVDGEVTSHPITLDTNASGTGTAAYFELVDRNSNMVVGGGVGALNSGSLIELNKTTITAGDTVSVESMSFRLVGTTRRN